MNITNARRDPGSNAVVFTDTRAYAAARIRNQRSIQIAANETEVSNLRGQVNRLAQLVEQLLENSSRKG